MEKSDLKYKRILLKISGEALLGDQQFGIDQKPVKMIASEIKAARESRCRNCRCCWRR